MTDTLPPCPAPFRPPEGAEPDPQVFIDVRFGDDEQHFLRGHALSVAEILDAMDGYTSTFWTTDTHKLKLTSRFGTGRTYSDPDARITLEDGDVFEAVAL